MTRVFILCRKKAKNNSSYLLEQALKEVGIDAYRCTAAVRPRKDIRNAVLVINHGVSAVPVWLDDCYAEFFNTAETVNISANKLRMTGRLMQEGVQHLESTTSNAVARSWLDDGMGVVSRTILTGCRGKGIVLSPPDPLPHNAPLYTQLYTGDNVREYRVYIVGGRAIDITEKRRYRKERRKQLGIKSNVYTRSIRTNGNGWVFARNTMQAPPEAQEEIKMLAEQAARACKLRWGGVDIIAKYTDGNHLNHAAVIEVNTGVSLVGDKNTRHVMAQAVGAYLTEHAYI